MKKNILMPVMVLSWSAYFVLCDVLIKQIGSPLLVGALLRIGTFVLLSIYLVFTKHNIFSSINKANLFNVLLTGIIAFVYDFLINLGLKYSTATAGTALLKVEILFVFLLSIVFKKDKFNKLQVLWVLFMMIGAGLTVVGSNNGISFDLWSLLFVLSALLNAICAFLLKKLQSNEGPKGIQIAYINNVVSMLLYIILFIVIHDVEMPVMNQVNYYYLFGCIICQALLISTYYSSLGRYPVWIVKTVVLAIPVLTLVFQLVLFRVPISIVEVFGIILTLSGGALLVITSKSRKKSDDEC